MKRLEGQPFDQWRMRDKRVIDLYGDIGDATCGAFRVPLPGNVTALIVASSGEGWDHVSVTINATRCPTWDEMCIIKDAFFMPREWAMQLHPPRRENINVHPYCLHLWRPHNLDIPLPSPAMVGPGTSATARTIVRI